VAHTGDGFQEGVPLSYVDQVQLFRKYTYGACQTVFNPLPSWYLGPLAGSWLRFLANRHVRWHHKAATSLYLSTYFAMAAAFYLVLAEAALSLVAPSFFDYYMLRYVSSCPHPAPCLLCQPLRALECMPGIPLPPSIMPYASHLAFAGALWTFQCVSHLQPGS
jgi:hypothetical protein